MSIKTLKYYFLLSFCIGLFTVQYPLAQPNRVSEKEVNIQKIFIDASKEKILGNYENAIYLFKEVLKKDKDNHAASYELARIYDVQEQNEKALKAIQDAIALDAENIWYQMFLADMYDKTGKSAKAADVFEKLVDKNSENVYYYEKWAFFLIKAGQADKAIKAYDQLESKFGIIEDISRKKHRLYLGMGDQKKAAKELETLIKSAPSNVDYHHMLASFYVQIGDKKNADKVYQQILSIDPDDARANIALAEDLKSSGDDISYLNTLMPVFEKADVNIDVKIKELIPYVNKIAEQEDKELVTALGELAAILEQVHPNEAKTYSVYGDVLYYAGDNKRALKKYSKALELNKSVFTIWEQVMYINLELGDFDNLLQVSEKTIDRFPNQAKAYYFNGIAYGQLKKHQDALSSFRQALLMSRKDPVLRHDIYNHMATEHYQLKEYKKSFNAFEEALKINPQNHNVLNRYSHYLTLRGTDLTKAKELSAKANELYPNNPLYQDTYGWILYKTNEYKAAKEWLSKALSNGGESNPGILEHYGDALFQLNDVENAMLYWQKAQEKGSTSNLLEKKIADRKLYE